MLSNYWIKELACQRRQKQRCLRGIDAVVQPRNCESREDAHLNLFCLNAGKAASSATRTDIRCMAASKTNPVHLVLQVGTLSVFHSDLARG